MPLYKTVFIGNCEQGTLRLSGGRSPDEGFLEVCSGGFFSSICLNPVQLPDSVDVCTSLGFPGGKCITPYGAIRATPVTHSVYILHYYNPPQLEFGSMH